MDEQEFGCSKLLPYPSIILVPQENEKIKSPGSSYLQTALDEICYMFCSQRTTNKKLLGRVIWETIFLKQSYGLWLESKHITESVSFVEIALVLTYKRLVQPNSLVPAIIQKD